MPQAPLKQRNKTKFSLVSALIEGVLHGELVQYWGEQIIVVLYKGCEVKISQINVFKKRKPS